MTDDTDMFTEDGALFERRVLKAIEAHGFGYALDEMEMAHRLRALADSLEASGLDRTAAEWDPYRHAGVERDWGLSIEGVGGDG